MDSPSSIANGQLQVSSTTGDFNNIAFVIQEALAKLQTATLVRVVNCTNTGDLAPFGFVDVVPLVNQVDGLGNGTPHTTIYGLPYLRIQGGTSAFILDPVVGDVGMAAFASRDITKVKNTQAPANPGSFRMFSFSDGMYLGGMLNGTPTQYIRFGADGITVVSPTGVKLNGVVIDSSGNVTIPGNLLVDGTIEGAGVGLTSHHHTNVTPGSGNSGGPVG